MIGLARRKYRNPVPALLAGWLVALPNASSAQEGRHTIMPDDAAALEFQTAVGFSDAVIVDGMIYLSGVVAVPQEGETTMAPAFTRAFDRLAITLARAGAGWEDVVEFNTFHMDLGGQLDEFVEVKNRYIKAPFPAWTALGISSHYEPAGLVEIKITAKKPPE